MLLWDIIRDWFVMNIWGGYNSFGDTYGGSLGYIYTFQKNGSDASSDFSLNNFPIFVNNVPFGDWGGGTNTVEDTTFIMSLGDWLSTISTIIVLIALCFFFFLMVRWLFRLTAGLIQGRG